MKLLAFVVVIQLLYTCESKLTRSAGDNGNQASLTSLKHKLNQILDSESKEMGILQNLLTKTATDGLRDEAGVVSESETDTEGIEPLKRQIETDIGSYPEPDNNVVKAERKKYLDKAVASKETIMNLREQGIISKLHENSKRMDTMTVFLADLRNVLSEAITAQAKQMSFESQVVELREEIEYLRKEVQVLKKEQTLSSFTTNPSLENKIHNDETTIEWLKESTKELHAQMKEISRSCNATSLLQINQKLEQQTQRQQSDLVIVQKQIGTIQAQQLRQDEEIREAKGNIEDVRSWQTNMGQKFIDSQQLATFTEADSHQEISNDVVGSFSEEEHFLTEALKDASLLTTPVRHNKKLKAKLREISQSTKQLSNDHYRFHKRLVKVESSQKVMKSSIGKIKQLCSSEMVVGTTENSQSVRSRMDSLEDTMSQYSLTLQGLGDKMNVINELQESSSQVFSALEGLETRYDDRLTEMQTSLTKIDASTNAVSNSNEDLKEQQNYQADIIQILKKDLQESKGKLKTNHLRLASIQSQLLKWSAQKCYNENSESIQNIRISSLESLLMRKDP